MTITYRVESGLYINITNQCTNQCDFCIRQNGDGAYGSDSLWLEQEPSREEILAAILAEDIETYSEIVFCGYGEPTCRLDDMLWVCKEIRKHTEKPIRLNTNGQSSLLYGRDTAPEFAGCFDAISISLNESTAKKYDAICHSAFGEDAFYGILDFARKVKVHVPQVVLSVVRQFLSTESLEECKRICGEIGVPIKIREYISG